VLHHHAAGEERVGEERAVTPPRHRLRAHDRDRSLLGERPELAEPLLELRRLHVIGVAAEGGVPPGGVLLRALPRVTEATEAREVDVPDPGAGEGPRQRRTLELGVGP
jgi:hypothetical protein